MNPRIATVCALLSLGACTAPEEPVTPVRVDWVLKSHVAFLAADGKTPRAVPAQKLRLWVPYVVGDIYGAPNAGELAPVTFNPDLSFVLDLNKSHEKLAKALIPTEFSQKWMIIEPAAARIARLSPFVLPVDGIAPVGVCEWLDADTGTKLMLVYLDRPARIRGEIVHEGRNLRFDIEAKEAGYLWIRQPEGSGVYSKATWPGRVVLAVMPNS
ncbi:MAG: hypothetical protein ABI769_15375 [Pseudomonadota bacterium]